MHRRKCLNLRHDPNVIIADGRAAQRLLQMCACWWHRSSNYRDKMEGVFVFYLYRLNGAAGALTRIAGAYGSQRGAKKTIEDHIGSVNYEVEADQVFAVAKGACVFRIHCVRAGPRP
jgi:hypothetical protein